MGQKKGNPTPSYQNQAYEALRPNTNARENRDYGTKPVMIDDTKTLDELIDSGSQGFTQGYAKDTDLTDGTINARFDTLTANEYHVTILSSSVMYANGSNKLGDSADDRHEFTGSILIGGDVLGNARLNQATASIQFATASLNLQTGSQDLVNRRISSTTGSINTTTSSFDSVFLRISSTTGSINTTTSSFDSVFLGISSVTGAMNTQSSSQNLVNLAISTYTGSNDSVVARILQTTASIQFATASLNTYTGSNDSVVARILQTTASLNTYTGSLIGITNGLMAVTASMKAATIFSGSVQIGLTLSNYANDGAAASGGVPVGGLYHTAGAVKVRLT